MGVSAIDILLVLLTVVGRIAMAVLIIMFGVSPIKSSWKMIKGVEEREEGMQRFHDLVQAKLNKKLNSTSNNGAN